LVITAELPSERSIGEGPPDNEGVPRQQTTAVVDRACVNDAGAVIVSDEYAGAADALAVTIAVPLEWEQSAGMTIVLRFRIKDHDPLVFPRFIRLPFEKEQVWRSLHDEEVIEEVVRPQVEFGDDAVLGAEDRYPCHAPIGSSAVSDNPRGSGRPDPVRPRGENDGRGEVGGRRRGPVAQIHTIDQCRWP
jgi:hypothetical protein